MDEQKPKPKAIPAPDLGYDRWILIDENTGRQNLKNLNSSKKTNTQPDELPQELM